MVLVWRALDFVTGDHLFNKVFLMDCTTLRSFESRVFVLYIVWLPVRVRLILAGIGGSSAKNETIYRFSGSEIGNLGVVVVG